MVAQTLDFTCGAACFDSMYRYLNGESPGEMFFARELGALDLGYTPPANVAALARKYGFHCQFKEGADVADIAAALIKGQVAFITWWYEDSGHYSLVRSISPTHIELMDPWTAREGSHNRLTLSEFKPNWRARGALLITVTHANF